MKQTALSRWLKAVILAVGLCGLGVYFWIVPTLARSVTAQYPEFSGCLWPWLCLVWATAIPCYAALLFCWKIARNIGADRSFCAQNGRLLRWISYLAAGDVALFLLGNVVFLLLNMNHPSILLAALLIFLIGMAISVAAATLSHLVGKAAALQEQSDLTI